MQINNIDLKQLRYFVTVAEELHFTKAAKRLHMSQPPLTQHIKALEYHLGVELFVRTKRHVELTAAGQVFLKDARDILAKLDEASIRTKNFSEGVTGECTIGLSYSAPLHPLTNQILHGFSNKNSSIDVKLVLHDPGNVGRMTNFSEDGLDAAFVWVDKKYIPKTFAQIILADDPFQLVLPAGHRLTKKKHISLLDIKDEHLIVQPPTNGTDYYQKIEKLFASYELPLQQRVTHMVRQLPICVSMVAAGQGVALLPSFIKNLNLCGVVWKDCDFENHNPPSMEFSLIYSKNLSNPSGIQFVEFTKQHTKI